MSEHQRLSILLLHGLHHSEYYLTILVGVAVVRSGKQIWVTDAMFIRLQKLRHKLSGPTDDSPSWTAVFNYILEKWHL
ncbi:unnamed protein product [marine sediment metagenome]|uniref:Uncharacterized protein n=1 Tax=marine sediment metagenome TaxID=412755 RepID=X1DVW0_9ZZZZ